MANAWELLRKFEGGVVVETGQVGNVWYRLYSDGWLEQGQSTTGTSMTTMNKTVTFPKSYADTSYILVGPGFVVSPYGAQYLKKKTSSFSTSSSVSECGTMGWYACGYAAD